MTARFRVRGTPCAFCPSPNFFRYHCCITAGLARVECPMHGVKKVKVPWAREDSRFTLLFEQAAMFLVRLMPVLAAVRIIGRVSALCTYPTRLFALHAACPLN